jgi:outer membrane immunogenic protein
MNHRLLFSAAFFLTGLGTACASDLPATFDSDWTGFYGTLSAGYSDISTDGSQTYLEAILPPVEETDRDSDGSGGGIFGAGVGYNHDFGSLVLGLEGDISMVTNDGQLSMKDSVDVDYDWFATGRLRAGVDLDGTLLYGTGGVAALNAGFDDGSDHEDVTFFGWTAGGGIEHMMSESWTVRLEALYADFGSENFHLSPGEFGDVDTEIDTEMFVIRAGISLRL